MNEIVPTEGAVLTKPLKTYTVEYSSNNSGGSWWLTDEDWQALEKAGWNVHWYKDSKEVYCRPDTNGRWLGALAANASIQVKTYDMADAFRQAVESWRTATGANPGDEGCTCCGAPHSFMGKTGEHGEEGYESSWLDSSAFRQVTYNDPW